MKGRRIPSTAWAMVIAVTSTLSSTVATSLSAQRCCAQILLPGVSRLQRVTAASGQTCSMVRRLLLIRHAKAEAGHRDLTRRLTERGRQDAREVGRWLSAQDLVPDAAVVSPATRAVQ